MNISTFKELVTLGLKPIPIKWDAETKAATSHSIPHGEITEAEWNSTTLDQWIGKIESANGIALKLFPPVSYTHLRAHETN